MVTKMAPRGEVVPTSPHPLRANSQLEHEVQLVATGAQRLRPFINYFHKILKWKGNENTISFIFYTVSLWIIFYGVHWILFGKKRMAMQVLQRCPARNYGEWLDYVMQCYEKPF